MTKDELEAVCNKDCKKKRLEKIVNIVYTIVKVVAGALIGHSIS